MGGANVDGEGHWHVMVDGSYYGYSTEGSLSVTGVDVGDHEVMVELMNNDHTQLNDRVVYKIDLTVQ